MADSVRDANRVTTLLGVSKVSATTPTKVAVNPTTGAMLVEPTEVTPTDTSRTNPSYVLTRNASNYITSIAQVIGGTTYTKTITRDVDNYIISIGAWV